MQRPALVIMAAGMGSRFGGLKQIEPVDDQGHILMDFSLFDAYQAGFRDIVFIIKPEIEQAFKVLAGKGDYSIGSTLSIILLICVLISTAIMNHFDNDKEGGSIL